MEKTELRRDRYSGLLVSCRRFRESIDGHQLGYNIFHRGYLPHCGRTVFCFASAQADLQQNCRLQEIRGVSDLLADLLRSAGTGDRTGHCNVSDLYLCQISVTVK